MDDRIDRSATSPLLLFAKLTSRPDGNEPIIKAFYPTDYDEQQLHTIKKYAFPFDQQKGFLTLLPQEAFTFIITRENGKYNFGYCLIENDFNGNISTVHCILSTLPWKKSFYDILRYIIKLPPVETAKILQKLRKSEIPTIATPIVIAQDRLVLCPPVHRPNSISSDEYYHMYMLRQSMSPGLLIDVFVSLLFERRIILRSNSLGTLTDVCSALESLLFPFKWQGIYIIPLHVEMLDYCHAPTPYLIGVHSSIFERLMSEVGNSIIDENISILDIDKKAFYSNTKEEDYDSIPRKVMKELESNLKGWDQFGGREIKDAFVTCQARLLSNYTCGWLNSDHFNKDDFVASHRSDPSFQMFAEKLIQVQMFEQYVTMKEDKRRKFEGRDGFDTVISNLPELKSNLDALKKFGVGLLEKGKKEIQNKNKQLRKEFEKNRMNSFGNPSQPGFQSTNQNQPVKTNSVIVARELFADDSPTDSEPIEKSRPARPPPPTPSAINPSVDSSPVQQRPISLINFSSPETLSPTEKSKTIAPKMVDNYSLLSEWSSMSLSSQPVSTAYTGSATMTGNTAAGSATGNQTQNSSSSTSWLHSNMTKPKSDLDEFDPLA